MNGRGSDGWGAPNGWRGPNGWGWGGERGEPERVGRESERVGREEGPNGWRGPEGAEPRRGGAQNIAFFPSPATFFFLPSLSGRSFRGILVVFEASGS